MSRRRAVITGVGPITCIGRGRENFWNGVLAEKSGINAIASFDPSAFNVRCAGEIRDWDSEEFFAPHRLKRLDRYAQFAVASAKLALDDARFEYSREKPQDRVGVSFGTALGGVCKAEDQYIRYLKKGARGVQPTLAVQVFGGSAHSNIAIDFGFRGVGTTNSNSCASGTVSVGEALRYIRYLEQSPNRNIVVMAATRSGIPISWTSEQIIDRDRLEVRFHHLKAFTKGMRVVWTFQDATRGVLVEIKHDLTFRVNVLAPIAAKIVGDFFIHNIANKTLRCMKSYVEARANKVAA